MNGPTKITADLGDARRVETGGLQINGDWPGLFIRGDDAAYLLTCIDNLMENMSTDEKNKNVFMLAQLQGISDTIKSEVIVNYGTQKETDNPPHV
jgi:hypothetical protein